MADKNLLSAFKAREDDELEDERAERAGLLTQAKKKVGKYVRGRWDRLEEAGRDKRTQIKVNYLRYRGEPFVQVHPNNPNRIWRPRNQGSSRLPPTINKVKRAVHRYVAQVTADEPIMEAVPATNADASRDAAEAADHILKGEWDRLDMHEKLQRAVQFAAVMRSAFLFFEWDGTEGGRVPAQKYFTDEETGDRYLAFVDGSGEEVEDEEDAETIWEGNLTCDVLTPLNVRWTGGRYADEADELMVARLVTLRELYDAEPDARDLPVEPLLTDVPPEAKKWLNDLRGADYDSKVNSLDDDDLAGIHGEDLEDSSSLLDEQVFLLHYFRRPNRSYEEGLHVVTAGKRVIHRGELPWGRMPVAHIKLLDELSDILGEGLVDLLRDPQELLDFVNGQILRYLQMLKRRWFVPLGSQVKGKDLLSPTQSIIEYNPDAGQPQPEVQPEIPNSLMKHVDRFNSDFDDMSGIHETMQGKHVPGVSSGRHAEALRAGDETLLGLTKTQIRHGLESAGETILAAVKEEWTRPRLVQYGREDRSYFEEAFKGADVADTNQVRLKRGTMLMMTPAQKLETLFGYAEMQVIGPDELRRLAPITDTAGVSLSEDPHHIRARRQNEKFLAGPPDELLEFRDEIDEQSERLQDHVDRLNVRMSTEQDPSRLEVGLAILQEQAAQLEQAWQEELQKYLPQHEPFEDDPEIALIHSEEHARALARQKVKRLRADYPWWVRGFVEHQREEWQTGHPEFMQAQAAAEQEQSGSAPGRSGPPATEPQMIGGQAGTGPM
jgi:hypothetical protein